MIWLCYNDKCIKPIKKLFIFYIINTIIYSDNSDEISFVFTVIMNSLFIIFNRKTIGLFSYLFGMIFGIIIIVIIFIKITTFVIIWFHYVVHLVYIIFDWYNDTIQCQIENNIISTCFTIILLDKINILYLFAIQYFLIIFLNWKKAYLFVLLFYIYLSIYINF